MNMYLLPLRFIQLCPYIYILFFENHLKVSSELPVVEGSSPSRIVFLRITI